MTAYLYTMFIKKNCCFKSSKLLRIFNRLERFEKSNLYLQQI